MMATTFRAEIVLARYSTPRQLVRDLAVLGDGRIRWWEWQAARPRALILHDAPDDWQAPTEIRRDVTVDPVTRR